MNENIFWEIIERARTPAASTKEVLKAIEGQLASMPIEDVLDFGAWLGKCLNRSDDSRLDVACGIICRVADFVSDDSFLYFQCWLIAQGKETFEAALSDPDSLASLPPLEHEGEFFAPSPFLEELLYVMTKPFEMKSGGKPMSEYREVCPFWKQPIGSEISSKPRHENFWGPDKAELRRLFPKLTARFLPSVLIAFALFL
jgi:hypothetical protein